MDNLLDIKQLAAYLGLSVGAAYRRHQRGQLPAPVRLGRSLRWREDDINSMIAAKVEVAITAIARTHLEYARAAIIAGQAHHTENEEMTK